MAQHRQPATLDADAYRYVSQQLTTSAHTTRLRFVLVTSLPESGDRS